ncbi:uncharacterized protein LOC111252012 isoform X3 [Varroa destructor]|uniref:Ras-associating domain-containing protein n=1 Tax=Varroa destructor TaxID=109461 RepID=A0A7M7KKI6_VARDE|nr:uncharacterized protein LOC111252012 isoform X3 [Varroa destructor]
MVTAEAEVMVKVYARVLCSDIEYKTLCIDGTTSAQQVIMILLQKFKMKHRDPNLYYLTMEVWMRSTGIPIRTIMVLDDEARPAELQACHPKGESKFLLQTRRGGLIRVYDSCLMAGSLYKSLLVSEKTTAEQVVQLVLHCYNSLERPSKFALYLVSHTSSYERMVYPQEVPLKLQQDWPSSQRLAFHLRRAQTTTSCPSTWSTGSTGSNSSASSTLSSESVSSIQSVFHSRPTTTAAALSHNTPHTTLGVHSVHPLTRPTIHTSLSHQQNEPLRRQQVSPPSLPLLLSPPLHKHHQGLQPSSQELYIHRLRTSRSSVELSSAGSSSSASSATSASPGSSPAPTAVFLGSGGTANAVGGGLVAPGKSHYNSYENCFYI